MKELAARIVPPGRCPYCQEDFTVFRLNEDSPKRRPFRGMPYDPAWFCVRCGGVVLQSYSGGVFWGKKLKEGQVAYRFMLTLQGREVYFLDHHYFTERVVGEKQAGLFYDIIEMMPVDETVSGNGDGWWFHLTYPAETQLVTFSGSPDFGQRIMKEAIESLGLDAGFPEE